MIKYNMFKGHTESSANLMHTACLWSNLKDANEMKSDFMMQENRVNLIAKKMRARQWCQFKGCNENGVESNDAKKSDIFK